MSLKLSKQETLRLIRVFKSNSPKSLLQHLNSINKAERRKQETIVDARLQKVKKEYAEKMQSFQQVAFQNLATGGKRGIKFFIG